MDLRKCTELISTDYTTNTKWIPKPLKMNKAFENEQKMLSISIHINLLSVRNQIDQKPTNLNK